jgi:hypothetical protein
MTRTAIASASSWASAWAASKPEDQMFGFFENGVQGVPFFILRLIANGPGLVAMRRNVKERTSP